MMITDIRQKLHQFIDFIEDEKIEAIYTLFKEDIERDKQDYSNDFAEINRRYAEMESGQVKGADWEDVKHRARHSHGENK